MHVYLIGLIFQLLMATCIIGNTTLCHSCKWLLSLGFCLIDHPSFLIFTAGWQWRDHFCCDRNRKCGEAHRGM